MFLSSTKPGWAIVHSAHPSPTPLVIVFVNSFGRFVLKDICHEIKFKFDFEFGLHGTKKSNEAFCRKEKRMLCKKFCDESVVSGY